MKFELKGYNIDNLLKTLYLKKINLYNLERFDYNRVVFEVEDKYEKKVKRYVANFKVTQTLSKIKQLPRFLLNNLGLIIGIFFVVIFYIFISNFTWNIEIFGTKDLNRAEIVQVLNDNGIKVGKMNMHTNEEIEDILLNKYDRIAQVSVIKQGTSLIINLSEKLVYTVTEYEPIKAKYSGMITKINIVTGTTNVKVGDYVNAGDILVLPFNINANGEKVSVKPLAEIQAEIFVVGKAELNKTENVLVKTGRTQTEYTYKLFNHKIFSGKNKNSFALFETDVYNENISRLIPFSREVTTFYEMEYQQVSYDFSKEKDTLIEKSKTLAYRNLPIGEILSESSKTNILGDKMFAFTNIKVLGIINA